MDTKIRDIDPVDWENFKHFCRQKSGVGQKPISANQMLKELIRDIPKGYMPLICH